MKDALSSALCHVATTASESINGAHAQPLDGLHTVATK